MSSELDHLKSGYANAQERIRDMDTKTNVLIGFQIAVVGMLVAAAFSVAKGEVKLGEESCSAVLQVLVILCWGASLALGLLAIGFLLSTLKARGPNGGTFHSALFPFYNEKSDSARFVSALDSIREDPENAPAEEYRDQLKQVGSILFKKVRRNRFAVNCLFGQIIAVLASALFFVLS